MNQANVVGLFMYPVKSCAGIALETMTLGARGPTFDREWMIVDETNHQFVTQRQLPKMALVRTRLTQTSLIISVPSTGGDSEISMPLAHYDSPSIDVVVWKDTCKAQEAAPVASGALSDFLGHRVKLVRMHEKHQRMLPEKYQHAGSHTGFADQLPFLLTSSESLADLNGRLSAPVPMDRFRPNIQIEGSPAFAEDGWKQIKIGDITLSVVKGCARCPIPTIDQKTAERSAEPLKTLTGYRRAEDGKVYFGMHLIHLGQGQIKKGDPVEIIS